MIVRYLPAAAMLAVLSLGAPALAVSPQEKMETCKFGADHQKLTGAMRKKFLARCMADSEAPARRTSAPQKSS